MKPLIIIRPHPGSEATVTAATAIGLDVHAFPMFAIRTMMWESLGEDEFDALILGSANALRHGGPALNSYADKPVYAVGATTAEASRNAGLNVVATGKGGLQNVLSQLDPAHTRLLRLTGAARVQLEPPENVTITERVVYSSDPLPMTDTLADLLAHEECVVALHSAEAASHFSNECDRLGLNKSRIALVTLGPRITTAANDGWKEVQTAPTPDEDALLALALTMCQKPQITHHPVTPAKQPETHLAAPAPVQDHLDLRAIPAAVPPQRRSFRGQFALALMAFLLGGGLVIWAVYNGHLDKWIAPNSSQTRSSVASAGQPIVRDDAASLDAISSMESRLAMLEDRFSRLNLQASAAEGHATKAENLLIAFAVRRTVDRGEPLRELAQQMQVRFGDAQPRAVRTITEFAKSPITVDALSARLEALGPELAGKSSDDNVLESGWRNFSKLFTVHREASPVMRSESRIERARVMLRAGRVSQAIDEVERLPGANAAATWITDAQRYADAQQALELIETAALIEPEPLPKVTASPQPPVNDPITNGPIAERPREGMSTGPAEPAPLTLPTHTPDAENAPAL